MGKSQIIKKLREGLGTNRQEPCVLAKLYDTQMQAEIYQDSSGRNFFLFDRKGGFMMDNLQCCVPSQTYK